MENEEELEECFYELGEGIIDQLGEEIDRIERKLKVAFLLQFVS